MCQARSTSQLTQSDLTRHVKQAWVLRKDSTPLPSIDSRDVSLCNRNVLSVVNVLVYGSRTRRGLHQRKKALGSEQQQQVSNEASLLRRDNKTLAQPMWPAVNSDNIMVTSSCATSGTCPISITSCFRKTCTTSEASLNTPHHMSRHAGAELANDIANYQDEPGLEHALTKP